METWKASWPASGEPVIRFVVLVTMTVKLFADLMSQPARAVAIFCRAANIQVRCYLVDIVRQTERCGSTSW